MCILCVRALSRCEEMIQRYSRELHTGGAVVAKAVEDCMRAIIGVLLNLTHDNGQHSHTHTPSQTDNTLYVLMW